MDVPADWQRGAPTSSVSQSRSRTCRGFDESGSRDMSGFSARSCYAKPSDLIPIEVHQGVSADALAYFRALIVWTLLAVVGVHAIIVVEIDSAEVFSVINITRLIPIDPTYC